MPRPKCPSCKTPMILTEKGVICPLCSQKRVLTVRFRSSVTSPVYEVLSTKNVLVSNQYLNCDQLEYYRKQGIVIDVQF